MKMRKCIASVLAIVMWMSQVTSVPAVNASQPLFAEVDQARKQFEVDTRRIESELHSSIQQASVTFRQGKTNTNQRQLEFDELANTLANDRNGGLTNGRLSKQCVDWARDAVSDYESKMDTACTAVIHTYEEAIKRGENSTDRKSEKHLKRELARVIRFRDTQSLQPAEKCIRAFRLTADSAADWSTIAKAYSREYRLDGQVNYPMAYALEWEFASRVPGWQENVGSRIQWTFAIEDLKALAPELCIDVDSDRLLHKWSLVKTIAAMRRTLIRFGSKALSTTSRLLIRERAKELYKLRFDLNNAFEEIEGTRIRVTEGNGATYDRNLTFVEELSQKFVAGFLDRMQKEMMDEEAENQFLEYSEHVAQIEHQIWFHLHDHMSELPRSKNAESVSISADYSEDAFPEFIRLENSTGKSLEKTIILVELRFHDQVEPSVLGCFVQNWKPNSKVEIDLPHEVASTLRPVTQVTDLPIRLVIADGLCRYIDQHLILAPGSKADAHDPDSAIFQLKPAPVLTRAEQFIQSAIETIQRHNACVRENAGFIEYHVQNCLKQKRNFTKEEQKALTDDAKRVKNGQLPKYCMNGKETTIRSSRNRVLRELSLLAEDALHQGCHTVAECISTYAQAFAQAGALKRVPLPSMQVLVSQKTDQTIEVARHFDTFIETIESRLAALERKLLSTPYDPRKPKVQPRAELAEFRSSGNLPKSYRSREKIAINVAIQKLETALADLRQTNPNVLDQDISRLREQLNVLYGPLLAQAKQ